MIAGYQLHELLRVDHQRALYDAAVITNDEFLLDIESLMGGAEFSQTNPADLLPRKYLLRYDTDTTRNLLACLYSVIWKLWSPDHQELACLGEELVLHIMIERAESQLRMRGKKNIDFEILYECMFQDTDFEILYAQDRDGFEETVVGRDIMGIDFLAIEDWFTPFNNVPYVHPLLEEPPTQRYKPPKEVDC